MADAVSEGETGGEGADARRVRVDHGLQPEVGSGAAAGPAAEYRMSQERRGIVEFIREAGEPVSPKEVSDAIGGSRAGSTIRNLLRKMVRDGELLSTPGARYLTPDMAPSSSS